MSGTGRSYPSRHVEHAEALALSKSLLPADHPDIAKAMIQTAGSYFDLGRYAEALDLNEQVLALRRRLFPADHPDVAKSMMNTASCYFHVGRHAEALHIFEPALGLFQRMLPADHPAHMQRPC
jgi:tetratricopeptide (TPR) repeat protein